jgi:S1-C subfamily serine protease
VYVPATIDRGFTRGVYIDSVIVGGPAALAGVRRGDIITRVGETALGEESFAERLLAYAPGEVMRVTVDRGGEEVIIDVQLGKR